RRLPIHPACTANGTGESPVPLPVTMPNTSAGLALERPLGEDAGEVLPVIHVGVEVVAGGRALGRQLRRFLDRSARLQCLLRRGGTQRSAAHGGERDPAAVRGDADDRPVVGPPDELL